jgi:hypothetical protein
LNIGELLQEAPDCETSLIIVEASEKYDDVDQRRIPVGKVTVLVVTAFFASTCAFHFQHSWYSGHVSKHHREARARCVQTLLGAPSPEFSYYGV